MAATLRLHSMSPVSKEQKTAERYMLLLGSLPLRMRRLPSPSQVCVSPVVGHRPVLCVYEGGIYTDHRDRTLCYGLRERYTGDEVCGGRVIEEIFDQV